jgi:sporulation protein YlmC with PRC-barrel domain
MMHPTRAGIGLVRLGDSDFVPANPEDDVRGKDAYDTQGQPIGSVEDLYIDRKEREVRFLEVGAGGFLGIGEKRFLVPVEAVTQVTEDRVTIEPERTQKVEGPAPFDTKVAPPPVAEDRRAEDYASPPYGKAEGTADQRGGYPSSFPDDRRPFL